MPKQLAPAHAPAPLGGSRPFARSQVASYVGYLFRRAHLRAAQCVAGQTGLHPKYLAILQVLISLGPLSQRQLADYLGVNRSVMVKLIDDLEANGEVARRRSAGDRRSYALEITPAGRSTIKRLMASARSANKELTRDLSAAERRRLNALLGETLAPYFQPPPPAELGNLTGFLIAQAHMRLQTLGDEALADLGLATRTFVALAVTSYLAPCAQHELAAWLAIGPPATVDLVDDLEALGALRRARSATDRRSYALEVTPEGWRLLDQSVPRVASVEASFTRCLGEDGFEEFLQLLAKLADVPTAYAKSDAGAAAGAE